LENRRCVPPLVLPITKLFPSFIFLEAQLYKDWLYQAMEMILTGVPTAASEMERLGVVNRIVSGERDVVTEALAVATTVAEFSAPAVGMAKQAVKAGKLTYPWTFVSEGSELMQFIPAETTTLDAGLALERALYYSTFSLEDCREGVDAFLSKRSPQFQHRWNGRGAKHGVTV
jgi:enoyl-CoA hydratase